MISTRGSGQASGAVAQVTQVSSFKEKMALEDPRFLGHRARGLVERPYRRG